MVFHGQQGPIDVQSSPRRYARHVLLHCRHYRGDEVATADDFLTDYHPDDRLDLHIAVRTDIDKRCMLPGCDTAKNPLPDSHCPRGGARPDHRQPKRPRVSFTAVCHLLWCACGITQLQTVQGMPAPPRKRFRFQEVDGVSTTSRATQDGRKPRTLAAESTTGSLTGREDRSAHHGRTPKVLTINISSC